jgi:hypothetical protein
MDVIKLERSSLGRTMVRSLLLSPFVACFILCRFSIVPLFFFAFLASLSIKIVNIGLNFIASSSAFSLNFVVVDNSIVHSVVDLLLWLEEQNHGMAVPKELHFRLEHEITIPLKKEKGGI